MRLHRQSRWYQEASSKEAKGLWPCLCRARARSSSDGVNDLLRHTTAACSYSRARFDSFSGTGTLQTPEWRSPSESHRQRRWFHETMRSAGLRCILAAMLLLLVPQSTLRAVIKRKYPLKSVIAEAEYILEAKVTRLEVKKKRLVVEVIQDFKGKLPFRRLNINLASGRAEDSEKMLRRLREDLHLVLFVVTVRRGVKNRDAGKEFRFLGFSEGTWFSLSSRSPPPDSGKEPETTAAVCAFRCSEIYMRRTYAGTTSELARLLPEVLAGKRPAPRLNDKEKPGLGPELPPRKVGGRSSR